MAVFRHGFIKHIPAGYGIQGNEERGEYQPTGVSASRSLPRSKPIEELSQSNKSKPINVTEVTNHKQDEGNVRDDRRRYAIEGL